MDWGQLLPAYLQSAFRAAVDGDFGDYGEKVLMFHFETAFIIFVVVDLNQSPGNVERFTSISGQIIEAESFNGPISIVTSPSPAL